MKKKHPGILDSYTKDQLQNLIDNSSSIREVLKKIGLCGNGAGGYEAFYKTIRKYNINIESLKIKAEIKRKSNFLNSSREKIPYEEILIENSNFSRVHLKNRLLKDSIIKNVCAICGQLPIWNDKPLTLELDHINGINNDHRIENLRILCGHCHSQLTTTGSRRLKKSKKIKQKINILETLQISDESKTRLENAITKHLKIREEKQLILETKNTEKELKLRKTLKLEKDNVEKVISSDIDFFKFGWVNKVSQLINKKHQHVSRWMKKYLPEIYRNAFRRNTIADCGQAGNPPKVPL